MTIPKILIIDDTYGHNRPQREAFCRHLGLWDMEGGRLPASKAGAYIAQAHFCPGQTIERGFVRNDMALVKQTIADGWHFKDGKRSKEGDHWALILIDYEFPSGRIENGSRVISPQQGDHEFGAAIVKMITEEWPLSRLYEGEQEHNPSDIPFVMFSTRDQREVELRVDSMGSRAFMHRPEKWTSRESAELRQRLAEFLFLYGLVEDGALCRVDDDGNPVRYRKQEMVGKSLAFLRTLRKARAASRPEGLNLIFVTGGIGAGKEGMAKYIHDHSRQSKKCLSCELSAKDMSDLSMSEIFGYSEGTFTGQKKEGKPSIFEKVSNGTLFIDEIGNCRVEVLKALLGATGGGGFSRRGDEGRRQFLQCQIVSATNQSTEFLVNKRGFPDDLIARFRATGIHVPPLSARGEDKRLLLEYFIGRECKKLGCDPKTPTAEAYEWVEQFEWPLNVRQIKMAVEDAVTVRKYSVFIQGSDFKAGAGDHSWLSAERAAQVGQPERAAPPEPGPVAQPSLESVMTALETFRIQQGEERAVVGAIPRLRRAAGQAVSRMLEASAKLPGNTKTNGDPALTSCLKTLAGNPELSPYNAKLMYKRIQRSCDLDEESPVVRRFKTQIAGSKSGGGRA